MKRLLALILPALLLLLLSCAMLVRAGRDAGSAQSSPLVLGSGQQVDDLLVVGRSLLVRGTVHESVLVVDGDLTLLPSARIDNDVAVVGGQLIIAPGATVHGALVQVGGRVTWLTPQTGLWLLLAYKLATALVILLAGLLLVVLFPAQLTRLTQTARAAPIRTVVAGTLGYLLAAAAAVLLAITIVGLPIALVLLLATFVAGMVGVAGAGLVLERWLGRSGGRGHAQAHRGMAILALLSLVPLLGEALLALLGVLGVGALLVSLAQARHAARLLP